MSATQTPSVIPGASSPGGDKRFLLRSVDAVRVADSGDSVDLDVTAVAFQSLGRSRGIITVESPLAQGLEHLLPNAPDWAAGEDGEAGEAAKIAEADIRRGSIRVRAGGPRCLRVTIVSGGGWAGAADGIDDGIVTDANPGGVAIDVRETPDHVEVTGEGIALRLQRRPFRLEVLDANGATIARSGGDRRQVAGFPMVPAVAFEPGRVSMTMEIAPGELFSGLGEQFSSTVHNGRSFQLIADDALGAGTGLTYKAVPVMHSSEGYSLFVNTPGPMAVDVGSSFPAVLELVNEEERLDCFIFAAPTLKERLSDYTAITGRMSVPPRWAFGVWMSRCRYRSRVELEEVAAQLRQRDMPCDVLHIDPDWLERDLLNCDFVWSDTKYPNPKAMIANLGSQGFHISVWALPYLDPQSPVFAEASEAGFVVTGGDGTPAQVARTFSRDGRPRHLVDFSNPAARDWWKAKNRTLLDLGVSVIKCDFGEGLPDDAIMSDGRRGRAWRNLYPIWYSRTVSETLAERDGTEALVWSRSGWAGSQRYPAQWGGDPEASVAGLAAELRAGISWSLSAPGLWAHDIGGFYGSGPSPELYVRWAQVGCLSPLARFHGLRPREPWEFGERAFAIVQEFAKLRYQLLPYLMSAAGEASRFGWPVMRPLALEFPDEKLLWHVGHEYMLGPDLLVVAVLDESADMADVEVILPPGEWVDFWTGTVVSGPRQMRIKVPLDRIPLYVRAGAVIPMGPSANHTGEIAPNRWDLHVWPGSSTNVSTVYDGEMVHRYRPEQGSSGWAAGRVLCREPARRAAKAYVHLRAARVVEVPALPVTADL